MATSFVEALRTHLEPFAASERRYRWQLLVALGWLALALGLYVGLRVGWLHASFSLIGWAMLGAAGVFLVGLIVRQWFGPDYADLAQRLERVNPHLNGMLITALEQQPDRATGRLHFLQRRLLQQTLEEARRQRWIAPVPQWRQKAVAVMQWAALAALLTLLVTSVDWAFGRHQQSSAVAQIDDVVVTPGDVSLEKGSALIVTARFRDLPTGGATLLFQPATGEAQRVPLQQNLGDPVFGTALPEVRGDLTYRVSYDGRETREYRITTFEFPRLERADAHLQYPAYTKLPEKNIADTKRVSAVEGTKLDVQFQLNKPVQSAELVAKDGTRVPLAVAGDKAELRQHQPVKSQAYELQLRDAEGRASKAPATFAIDVVPNRKPEIKIVAPKGDQRVSPLQEIALQTEVWDDFGLPAYGVTYTIAGSPAKEVVLGRDAAGEKKTPAALPLKMEELGVQPDQLISWFAWAEDVGPDGQPRRVSTDLYFAEVRPFEEIFRPGQSMEGSGQGAGEEAEKLVELQKQIIAATWKLQRGEAAAVAASGKKATGDYAKDEPVVLDAQKRAIELGEALRAKLEEPASQALAGAAIAEMQRAVPPLEKAATSPAPLPEALTAEQSAYNALLKLAAHEFRVSRSKGQGEGKEKQSAREQQLDQLEMKEEKERYETRQEATPQQKEETREQLAILNRLKELAQRQHDLNERLKELQVTLQEAKTDAEKEKLRQELKRLQEEQQQMLAEVDDLQQKMQGQQDPSKFAEERKQLEQTRGEAQKANEALRQEKAAEALAAGTRTERDLQQLRDDFRRKSSAQFNDQMRQMRNEARQLSAEQKELGEKLQAGEAKAAERPSLDGASPRDEVGQRLEKQTERLGALQEEMKAVSEQAEAAEPLLAKELYDTLRKAAQAGTDETLRKTSLLAKRGYNPQARQLSDKAGQEIDQLKAGVERAAESVLGNEEDSLRLARAELEDLTHQLNREIAQASPSLAAESEDAKAGSGDPKQSSPGSGQGQEKQPGQNSQKGEQGKGQQGKGEQGKGEQGKGEGQQGKGEEQGQPGKQGEGQQGRGEKGQGQGQQQGQGPGQQKGQGQEGQGKGEQPGQQGQGEGQSPNSQSPGGQQSSGAGSSTASTQSTPSTQPGSQLRQMTERSPLPRGGILSGAGGSAGTRGGGIDQQEGPIRGGGFVQWSDRLRNVEEMVDDPALRTEIARTREVARAARAEFKRHSEEPKWDLIQAQISKPLAQIRDRVAEELARRSSKDALVPIDRDPVPPRFAEQVQRYYEVLGSDGRAPAPK